MKWHYTTGDCLRQIVDCGELRPISFYPKPKERPAVWFSTNPVWEPSANKCLIDRKTMTHRTATLEEMQRLCGGLCRIGVMDHIAPFDWIGFLRECRISPERAEFIASSGESMGASRHDWFASFVPVPASDWLSVEMLRDGHWGLYIYDSREVWGRNLDG